MNMIAAGVLGRKGKAQFSPFWILTWGKPEAAIKILHNKDFLRQVIRYISFLKWVLLKDYFSNI